MHKYMYILEYIMYRKSQTFSALYIYICMNICIYIITYLIVIIYI